MDRQTTTNETEYEPSLMDMKYYCEMCVKYEDEWACNITGGAEPCIDLFISTLMSPWYNWGYGDDNEDSILKDIPFHIVNMKDRASNQGSRRFRSHGEGPTKFESTNRCFPAFNQEKALVGAFSVIVNSPRRFI